MLGEGPSRVLGEGTSRVLEEGPSGVLGEEASRVLEEGAFGMLVVGAFGVLGEDGEDGIAVWNRVSTYSYSSSVCVCDVKSFMATLTIRVN